jgi:hypothetical protein
MIRPSGFQQHDTYDKQSGLLLRSQLEHSDGTSVQTLRIELTERR